MKLAEHVINLHEAKTHTEEEAKELIGIGFDKFGGYKGSVITKVKFIMNMLAITQPDKVVHKDYGRGKGKYDTPSSYNVDDYRSDLAKDYVKDIAEYAQALKTLETVYKDGGKVAIFGHSVNIDGETKRTVYTSPSGKHEFTPATIKELYAKMKIK